MLLQPKNQKNQIKTFAKESLFYNNFWEPELSSKNQGATVFITFTETFLKISEQRNFNKKFSKRPARFHRILCATWGV